MRDYPFDFKQLDSFSNSLPYTKFTEEELNLFQSLQILESKYNFPAVKNNIGSLLSLMVKINKPKTIFEMGSGYGQSAFWFMHGSAQTIEQLILTEKRDDLVEEFHALNWPDSWNDKMSYHQDDAFEVIKSVSEVDFALVDGVKSNYKDFLHALAPKMSQGSLVAVDNSYWRGSFLDPDLASKKRSAANIRELHEFIKASDIWESVFIPFEDGLSLLLKV